MQVNCPTSNVEINSVNPVSPGAKLIGVNQVVSKYYNKSNNSN